MYQQPHKSVLPPAIKHMVPPEFSYLGEDPDHYYFLAPPSAGALHGFFDGLGNMFKRMTKFTDKSFRPSNLYKGFVNTTMAIGTGGMIYALPKNVRKTLYNVSKVAIPVVAAGIGAYYAGPAVMSYLGPKLATAGSLLGKGISTVGGKLFDFLGKLSPAKQAEVAQKITPRQIAQMETSGQLPSELVPMFQDAMAGSIPQYAGGYGGYTPTEEPTDEATKADAPSALGPLLTGGALLFLLARK